MSELKRDGLAQWSEEQYKKASRTPLRAEAEALLGMKRDPGWSTLGGGEQEAGWQGAEDWMDDTSYIDRLRAVLARYLAGER